MPSDAILYLPGLDGLDTTPFHATLAMEDIEIPDQAPWKLLYI